MKRIIVILFLVAISKLQAQPWSQQLATTAMTLWKDSFTIEGDKVAKWRYDQGVILKGIEGIWNATGDAKWFNYIQKSMDFYVKDDGTIKGYRPDEYNIDHVNNGKLLLLLHRVTNKEKYKKAADLLRGQLRTHPRTSEGGFWHKKIYPSQMWLDGLYMGQPFYAEYAAVFGDDTAFNDITRQFVLMEQHARDPKSGLLYHGWDESKQQQWADKTTGLSPNVWGRALGWYGMAIVDALDHFPANHAGKDSIIGILNRFAKAVTSVQDKKTGLWYDVPNLPNQPKNYVEASASSMLVYALAKGVRKGYLPATYLTNAQKGYEGILKQFIKTENGQVNLHGTVAVSGLGGKPYRDGSFAYYMSEPVIVNDPKGMGAFINAAVEMEMVPKLAVGKGKTVVLDYFFNNEWKKDANGKMVRYHYTWEDKSNSGFSMLGDIFNSYGVQTAALKEAPTAERLKNASIYVIVDPDTQKETATPNFIESTHADVIYNWVKEGGVLLLFGNDSGNVEFTHFNQMAKRFGIQFNENGRNMVKGDDFATGTFTIAPGHPVYKTAKTLYIKELATLAITPPAKSVLTDKGDVVIAVSKVGKGTVFAVGDPWFYNEYLDGRKLPNSLENYKAAEDLVKWAIQQAPAKTAKPLAEK
jgi:unsaturated rhamnogalacturonyl hydrolase